MESLSFLLFLDWLVGRFSALTVFAFNQLANAIFTLSLFWDVAEGARGPWVTIRMESIQTFSSKLIWSTKARHFNWLPHLLERLFHIVVDLLHVSKHISHKVIFVHGRNNAIRTWLFGLSLKLSFEFFNDGLRLRSFSIRDFNCFRTSFICELFFRNSDHLNSLTINFCVLSTARGDLDYVDFLVALPISSLNTIRHLNNFLLFI